MMKHIGKHDQRRAVLLFKEVPGEDDMCLIVYTDVLPKLIHDPLMKCLESEVGQNAVDITGPLSRTLMDSGENVLNTIHANGYIRKVPTNQMIITPNANTTIRLDELNKILKEMAKGKDATQRMAELDANAGMKDPAKALPKTNEMPITETPVPGTQFNEMPMVGSENSVLTDAGIARGQLLQAEHLKKDAAGLLTEAESLTNEAYILAPELKPKPARKKAVTKKTSVKKTTVKVKGKRGPGRPKNAATSKG